MAYIFLDANIGILLLTLGGLIAAAVSRAFVTQPSVSLSSKFLALGNMTGMHKDQIIAKVGQPSSFSTLPGNIQLLQWQATGYHIAIRFDMQGMFIGITHEYAHKE